jgi:hypothetical protein
VEQRPNTTGIFCPLCDEWLEYVDWPSNLPPPSARAGVFYDPAKVVQLVWAEREAMLVEHMSRHTAAVVLDS